MNALTLSQAREVLKTGSKFTPADRMVLHLDANGVGYIVDREDTTALVAKVNTGHAAALAAELESAGREVVRL